MYQKRNTEQAIEPPPCNHGVAAYVAAVLALSPVHLLEPSYMQGVCSRCSRSWYWRQPASLDWRLGIDAKPNP